MSLKDEFTKTRQAKIDLEVERAAPRAWRAGRVTQDGETRITTAPRDGSQPTPEEGVLLAEHGFDPARYRIVGPIKSSTWTAYLPKEYRSNSVEGEPVEDAFTFTAKAFKFTVVERPEDEPSIDELVTAIGEHHTPWAIRGSGTLMPVALNHTIPYVVAVGDTQIGKELDSPTDELILRFQGLMTLAAVPAQAMAEQGKKLQHIHLPWLGDCIEGMNSQGGRLRWRTRLTLTEQVRILRRLMLWQVQLFAPLADRVTVVSVPGNHDEANSRDLDTRTDDSWAVDTLAQVADALELAGEYEHVECYVPGSDERDVVLEVGQTIVAHSHGHEHRHGKHFEYWAGQAFGGQPMGAASLWLQGHGHHLHFQEDGSRKWVQVPAVERSSVWWKHKTGTGGSPGIVTFQLWNNQISNLSKLEPAPLGEVSA